ncbi:hypothetical protein [Rhizobium paknamense]|uniref:Uncharacterized protein n=1 Tax=Rhizobium paknamense TaxID=1206817 RepID=A0ABU0I9Z8_9HYPH|nr:hypothetical protein [Rhizobium paknamense]MDQ0455059.1 hypothetical protein [Rhizobium paknamense]
MRIDSSLGNSQYQSRYVHGVTNAEDAAAETAVVSRSRSAGGNSTSTLLSASLANALWSLDTGKSSASSAAVKDASEDETSSSPVQQVEALYLEHMYSNEE